MSIETARSFFVSISPSWSKKRSSVAAPRPFPAQAAAARADKPPRPPAQRDDNAHPLEADRDHARTGNLQQTIECRADAHLCLLLAGLDTASLREQDARPFSHRPVTEKPARRAGIRSLSRYPS